jgi:hypothetical protein
MRKCWDAGNWKAERGMVGVRAEVQGPRFKDQGGRSGISGGAGMTDSAGSRHAG